MFCSQCGKEVQAGQKFCPECGAAVGGTVEKTVERPVRVRKYKCPKCGSYDMEVSNQITGTIGSSRAVSSKSSVGMSSVTSQKTWQCKDCGYDFVDPEEQREMAKLRNFILKLIIVSICFISFFVGMEEGDFIWILASAALGVYLFKRAEARGERILREIDEFEQSILTSNET